MSTQPGVKCPPGHPNQAIRFIYDSYWHMQSRIKIHLIHNKLKYKSEIEQILTFSLLFQGSPSPGKLKNSKKWKSIFQCWKKGWCVTGYHRAVITKGHSVLILPGCFRHFLSGDSLLSRWLQLIVQPSGTLHFTVNCYQFPAVTYVAYFHHESCSDFPSWQFPDGCS